MHFSPCFGLKKKDSILTKSSIGEQSLNAVGIIGGLLGAKGSTAALQRGRHIVSLWFLIVRFSPGFW